MHLFKITAVYFCSSREEQGAGCFCKTVLEETATSKTPTAEMWSSRKFFMQTMDK